MGNLPSYPETRLPQDALYQNHCRRRPEKSNRQVSFYFADGNAYACWDGSEEKCVSLGQGAHESLNHVVIEDSLLMAAAADCDGPPHRETSLQTPPHILDGYSWTLLARIAQRLEDNGIRKTFVTIDLQPVTPDEELRQRELRAGEQIAFGMFTRGRLPAWRKLLGGRMWELMTTGQVIERRTGHQPIYFPPNNQAYFASSGSYPCMEVDWPEDDPSALHASEVATPQSRKEWLASRLWVPAAWMKDFMGKWRYVCMHPQYDTAQNRLLTYTFKHSTTRRATRMWFYEFDGATDQAHSGPQQNPRDAAAFYASSQLKPIEYHMNDRVALHEFGYTQRFFVVFANSLQMRKMGTASLLCGTPIMRAINDDFMGDLVIHFVPRNRPGEKPLEGFIVNTKVQGNVYHTINCYDVLDENGEWDGSVVVDAFVSKLNAARESAQFELGDDEEVYDNQGESFRFHCRSATAFKPKTGSKFNNCSFQPLSSDVDSTIDFHCINTRYSGQRYSTSYMVSHRRHRNVSGAVDWVESRLFKIAAHYEDATEPLQYDTTETLLSTWSSSSYNEGHSSYLRTPLFVHRVDQQGEDQGWLFTWSYDADPDKHQNLEAYILMFDACSNRTGGLDLLVRIPPPNGSNSLPMVIPYNVHSNIYSRHVAGERNIEGDFGRTEQALNPRAAQKAKERKKFLRVKMPKSQIHAE